MFGGAIGTAIAWKFFTRAKEIRWEDFAERIHHAKNSHFVEVDNLRVHYQEFGSKDNPTLILIHGYSASTYVWQRVAPMFAEKNFHVVAVDLIGFGFSQKPAWFDYSIESQANMISRFMDSLGIEKATVIGSSYGGAVASTLALDYAEQVEKLVLVDAVCNDDVKNHPILRLANIRGLGEIISAFLVDSKLFLKRRMRGTLAPANHHLITKERIEAVRRPLNAADGHRSILQTARNWQACRIEQDAHFIKQSALIIWGERDTVIPIRNGEKLQQSISDSRFVVFKYCGHVPQEEASENFVEVVTEFAKDKVEKIGR